MLDDNKLSSSIFAIYQFLKILPESLRLKTEDEAKQACKNSLLEAGIDSPLNVEQSTVYLLLIDARANRLVCLVVWRCLAKRPIVLADLDENLLVL